MLPLHKQTIRDAATALRDGRTTPRALVEACLDEIDRRGTELNAFIAVLRDDALAAADRAGAELASGRDRGPLHGIPVSLKDLIDVGGLATTAASRVRTDHRAAADAPLVAHLRDAGAVLIGKCNLHEFAFGTTSEDSAYGPVRNPHDATRSAGGSSGGSAAAVVAGMCFASIGTDTGGSIRIPAAACGAVGFKPAYGDPPCEGVVPLSATLDHVGPLTRSVEDAWLVFEAMRGHARPAAIDVPPDHLIGRTLAVPRGYFLEQLDPDVRAAFEAGLAALKAAGASVEEVTIAHAAEIVPVYLQIVFAEAAEYHARTLESRPGDYSPEVRVRLELGRYVLAEDYVRAMRGRAVLRGEVDAALAGRDALVLPTMAIPAPPLGAAMVTMGAHTDSVRSAMLRLTQLFNLTGHPALSIPCGRTRQGAQGLPCAMQIVGHAGASRDLLALGRACEAQIAGV